MAKTQKPVSDAHLADLDRRRQMLALLMAAQTQNEGKRPTGEVVGKQFLPQWGDAIADAIKGYQLRKRDEALATEAREASTRQREELATQLAQTQASNAADVPAFMQQLQGYTRPPQRPPALTHESLGGPVVTQGLEQPEMQIPGSAANALGFAAQSQSPMVAELAKALGESQMKGMLTPQNLLSTPGAQLGSRAAAAMGGGPAALQPNIDQLNVDGIVYPKTDQGLMGGGQHLGQTFGPVGQVPGVNAIGQYSQQSGKFNDVSAKTPATPAAMAQNRFFSTVGEERGKALTENYLKLRKQGPAVSNMQDVIELGDAAFRGAPFSEIQQSAAKVLKAFGLTSERINTAIASGDSLVSVLGPAMLENLKQFGAANSLTDADRAVATMITQMAAAGDPRALKVATALYYATYLNAQKLHQEEIAALGPVVAKDEDSAKVLDSMKIDFAVRLPKSLAGEGYDFVKVGPSGYFEVNVAGITRGDMDKPTATPAGPPAPSRDMGELSTEALLEILRRRQVR